MTIPKGAKGDKGDVGAKGADGHSITITSNTVEPNGIVNLSSQITQQL